MTIPFFSVPAKTHKLSISLWEFSSFGSRAPELWTSILGFGLAVGFSLAASAASTNLTVAKGAATNAVLALAPIPQSTFITPKSRLDGVDPFFPFSKRLEFVESPNRTNPPTALGELVVKGFSGTVASPLVIINDHTFGVGDEGNVTTPQGRVRIRCLEIRMKNESVTVEANNERRELRFRISK